MKLVGTLEKKIMLRKMDFWLPLRVCDRQHREPQESSAANNKIQMK